MRHERLLFVVVHRYTSVRWFRAHLGSRLGSARRELLSSTRVTAALNAGTSMYATWAFQFYETLAWALAERFEQLCALSGYETCEKFLIRSYDVCSIRLGRNPNVLHNCQRAWVACDCVTNWSLRSKLIFIRPKSSAQDERLSYSLICDCSLCRIFRLSDEVFYFFYFFFVCVCVCVFRKHAHMWSVGGTVSTSQIMIECDIKDVRCQHLTVFILLNIS